MKKNIQSNGKVFLLGVCFSVLAACDSGSSGSGSPANALSPAPLCTSNAGVIANPQPLNIFSDLPLDQDSAQSTAPSGVAKRLRRVQVQTSKFRQFFLNPSSQSVSLQLFPGSNIILKVEQIQTYGPDSIVVSGTWGSDPHSSFTMSMKSHVLLGSWRSRQANFILESDGQGSHLISELTFADDGDCQAENSPESRDEAPEFGEDQADGTPVIDMLVAYTPAALARVGSVEAMQALIQMGIADTNKAFADSGVSLSVRWVGTMALSQNETGDFSADLSSLRSKSDGRWDEVHSQRAALGADQVTVVGSYPNNTVAGIGYIQATASSAFTIVKSSAFRAFTFSHELGHNVGLRHSDGYVNSAGSFRTIMAYGTVPRIRRFSNPEINYNGYLTGDSDQNSSLILNSLGGTTANLLSEKLPGNTGGESPTPTENPAPGSPSAPQEQPVCKP